MSTKEISAAAQALGRRGGMKSLGAKSKAELSAFGKAAAAKRWKKPEAVGGMFSAGAQQLEALAAAVGLKGAAIKAEPPKPKRPLPKAGTMAARVLAGLTAADRPIDQEMLATYYVKAIGREERAQVQNALSSLRSASHVVSEPTPGSRREKLWRLA